MACFERGLSDIAEVLEANADKPERFALLGVRHRLFPAGLCRMGVGDESVSRKQGETIDVCVELWNRKKY